MTASANRAFRFALAGLFTCCAPLGLVGAWFGWRVRQEALAAGVPVPRKATFALVAGLLSMVLFSVFFVVGWRKQQARDEVAHAASARLGGTRADLSGTAACDLVTEHLLAKEQRSFDAVDCPKAAVVSGNLASMSDIRATAGGGVEVLRACFGRASRWFVIAAGPAAECPPSLPATTSGADPSAEEDRLRQEIRTTALRDGVRAFEDRLAKARAAVRARAHAETACPALDISPWATGERARVEIGYVDFEVLDAAPGRDPSAWKFLTKGDVSRAIDGARSLESRSDSVASLTRKAPALLAVFVSSRRRWPVLHTTPGLIKDDLSFSAGGFEGWLSLVDLEASSVRCETRLGFANGARVRYRKGPSEKRSAEQALADDLESQFDEAAIAAIGKLGGGKLKLGVKLLE